MISDDFSDCRVHHLSFSLIFPVSFMPLWPRAQFLSQKLFKLLFPYWIPEVLSSFFLVFLPPIASKKGCMSCKFLFSLISLRVKQLSKMLCLGGQEQRGWEQALDTECLCSNPGYTWAGLTSLWLSFLTCETEMTMVLSLYPYCEDWRR